MKVEIKDYERVDDLHRNGYMLIQDPKRFCFGVDAVLLSGFATAKKGNRYRSNTYTDECKDKSRAFLGFGNSAGKCRNGKKKRYA